MKNVLIMVAAASMLFAIPSYANNGGTSKPPTVYNGGNGGKGGQGGDGGTGVGIGVGVGTGGEASAAASADATATADAAANSTSAATIENGAVVVNVEQSPDDGTRDVTPVVVNELPASSAAPSFSSVCTSGAAGGDRALNLSVGVTSPICEALMMADSYMALGDREEAKKWVKIAARHAKTKSAVGYIRHIATLGIL